MKKQLIINPTETEMQGLTVLVFETVYRTFMSRILGQPNIDDFKPMLFSERNARLLVSHIENKVIASSKYAGKQLDTYVQAAEYVNEVATQIYGDDWKVKLLKTEVLVSREDKLGIYTTSAPLAAKISYELEGLVDVVFHPEVKGHMADESPTKQERG